MLKLASILNFLIFMSIPKTNMPGRSAIILFVLLIFFLRTHAQVLQWSEKVGGSQNDNGYHAVVDRNGNLYLSGSFQGTNVDFDQGPGTFLLSSAGLNDGFVAKYDQNGKFQWAFCIGGNSYDEVGDIALDSAGNIVITGFFRGTGIDFDPSANNALLNSNGENGGDPGYGGDIFVAKYDTSGNYKWAFNIGGTDLGDNGIGVFADKNNDILVTGYFRSVVDFDPSVAEAKLEQDQGTLFVAKYNSSGKYLWAFNTGQGGNIDNTGFKIAADNLNNVIVTGFFQGINIDFDPSPAINSLSSSGSFEFFVAKYSSSGQYIWAKSAGGPGVDVGRSVTVDKSNNIYVTGDYNSSSINFNNGQAANILSNNGGNDLFLVKYSPVGEHVWSFGTGGSANEYGMSISRDDLDNVLIGGTFTGINVDFDPSPNTIGLTSKGNNDIYAVKYSAGGAYLCSFSLGGPDNDMGKSIVNYGNYSYLTGVFNGTNIDFDPLNGTRLMTSAAEDAFIAKYDWTIIPPAGTLTGSYDCTIGTAKMTFNATSGTGPFTLYISDGTTTKTFIGIQSGVPFTLIPSSTTTTRYVLTGIKDANLCSAVTQSDATLIIGTAPIAITTSGNISICKLDSVQLSASGGVSYHWSPSAGLSNPAISNPKASPLTTTTYKVVATNAAGCKDSSTLTVTVKPLPTITVAPATASFCSGDSVQLVANGGAIYQWTPAAGLSRPDIANPKAAPSSTTTYRLDVVTSEGCRRSLYQTVTKKTSPVISLTTPSAICPGDSVQLQASGGVGYKWSPADGLNTTGIANPIASPTRTTIYKVVVSNTEGCIDSVTTIVSLKPKPIVSVAPIAAICKGDTAQLSATGGASYQWSPATALDNATLSTPKAAPVVTTTYMVLATGINGCVDSSNAVVVVNQPPLLTLTSDLSVCQGDSTQLIASGGAMYHWSPSSGLNSDTVDSPMAAPTASTHYKVIVTTSANCSDSGFVRVIVNPKPIINLAAQNTICERDTTQLIASGGTIFQWTPTTGLSDATIANPYVFPKVTTNYKVVVANSFGCKDSVKSLVTVMPKPKPNLGNDALICEEEDLVLNATMLTAESYSWSTGETIPAIIINKPGVYIVSVKSTSCQAAASDTITVSNLPSPIVSLGKDTTICNFQTLKIAASGGHGQNYLWNTGITDSFIHVNKAGLYTVTASNKCGDTTTAIVVAVENCSQDIHFPTAFTPNRDGRNDIFKAAFLQGVAVFDYQLQVYNRWGEMVFSTKDLNKGWDGRIRGREQQTDVYVWIATYRTSVNGSIEQKKGIITLIR